ncbi:hypothetical protein PR048_018347 [Dryococelus australis]|uniref:PiggyBac transposable element-derived protein domain-containing protein n=1 Tax=Dryococelus australis TaxID=614101 RepID=A0ABQ9HC50_9NEOP|nr:hypothetical protein PR048_018347 [Dryococelus australis]
MSFFNETLINSVVFHKNLYATQKGKPFVPTVVSEIKTFIGINVYMGITVKPNYRDYWSTEPDLGESYVSQLMPVKWFSFLLSHLHLNKNVLVPDRNSPNHDKLYKLRPFLEHMQAMFLDCYKPHQKQAIDESMSGRDFDRMSGRKEAHFVYGQFLLIVSSLQHLEVDQANYSCGTVNPRRKYLPKLKEEKQLQGGEFDYRVSDDGVAVYRWKDNRAIKIISSCHDPAEVSIVNRKVKDGTLKAINFPIVVKDYNANMNFVDNFDRLKGTTLQTGKAINGG